MAQYPQPLRDKWRRNFQIERNALCQEVWILIEDPTKSFHAPFRTGKHDFFDNRLIFGDNLLALKALEQEFAGKIRCIYIDPPFNTGQAFPEYDDSIEHSLWLNMLYQRIPFLYRLLSNEGALFVEIDDTESSYLQVILDEVFGRGNRIVTNTVRRSAPTGHKAINPSPINVTDFVHVYAKNKGSWKYNPQFVARGDYDWAYSTRLINPNEHHENWGFESLSEHVAKLLGYETVRSARQEIGKKKFEAAFIEYAISHPEEAIRFAQPNYDGVSKAAQSLIDKSRQSPDQIFLLKREDYSDMYFKNGNRILFLIDKVSEDKGEDLPTLVEPLTNFWDDVPWQGIAKEGGVDFPKNKKPEKLLRCIIEMATKPGDWILDSFAGSGTTGAVAHKMGRRWILIELRDHCDTLT